MVQMTPYTNTTTRKAINRMKDSLTKRGRDAIKPVANELLEKLVDGTLQLDHWRKKATAQAQKGRDHQAPVFQSAVRSAWQGRYQSQGKCGVRAYLHGRCR